MATELIGVGAPTYSTLQAWIDDINAASPMTEDETGQLLSQLFEEGPAAHEFNVADGGFVLTLEAAPGAHYDPVTGTGSLIRQIAAYVNDLITINTANTVLQRFGAHRTATANENRETFRSNQTGVRFIALFGQNDEAGLGVGQGDVFLQGGGLNNQCHSCIAVGSSAPIASAPGFTIAQVDSIVENCVAYRCSEGFGSTHGTNRNCAAVDCTTGFTTSGTIDYAWSTDGSVSGPNDDANQDAAQFVDVANDDFRVNGDFPGFPGTNNLYQSGTTPDLLDAMDPADPHSAPFNKGAYNGSVSASPPSEAPIGVLKLEPGLPIFER